MVHPKETHKRSSVVSDNYSERQQLQTPHNDTRPADKKKESFRQRLRNKLHRHPNKREHAAPTDTKVLKGKGVLGHDTTKEYNESVAKMGRRRLFSRRSKQQVQPRVDPLLEDLETKFETIERIGNDTVKSHWKEADALHSVDTRETLHILDPVMTSQTAKTTQSVKTTKSNRTTRSTRSTKPNKIPAPRAKKSRWHFFRSSLCAQQESDPTEVIDAELELKLSTGFTSINSRASEGTQRYLDMLNEPHVDPVASVNAKMHDLSLAAPLMDDKASDYTPSLYSDRQCDDQMEDGMLSSHHYGTIRDRLSPRVNSGGRMSCGMTSPPVHERSQPLINILNLLATAPLKPVSSSRIEEVTGDQSESENQSVDVYKHLRPPTRVSSVITVRSQSPLESFVRAASLASMY